MKKKNYISFNSLPKLNSKNKDNINFPIINNHKDKSKSTVYKPIITLTKNVCRTYRKENNKIKKTLEIIHKLNLESNIKDIYLEEIKLEKKREKINNNIEIQERRLGIIQKKDSDSEEKEEEKDKDKIINLINNEINAEKMGTKEKEKKIEKAYHRSLKELQKIENDIASSTKDILELNKKIESGKLEINVIKQYGENFDKKQINLEVPTRVKEKKNTNRIKSLSNIKPSRKRMSVALKINDIEKESKILIKKFQREEKQKQIKSKVNTDIEELHRLQKENEKLKEKYAEKKTQILELKKELINIYHSLLYEGLDFRGPGLTTFIINIWNLGINVDKNFMPTYLDKISIDFLFNKARQIIEKNKLKKQIEEAEIDFINSLKKWREKEHLSKTNNLGDFFKTKISEDESFYEYYPKTKIFMDNYRKKNEKNEEIDKVENFKVNSSSFKSVNIPDIIMEKYRKIEKSKFLFQSFKNQMDKDEKNEVLRISREFFFNEYERKYKVCIETIINALCGDDHKDAQLNYYNKIKKEYKDNLKKIEFYKKLKTISKDNK